MPSRISFFTGRYAHSHRNRVNYTPLDPSEVLMQARLKEAGYQTAAIGKLHYTPPTPDVARARAGTMSNCTTARRSRTVVGLREVAAASMIRKKNLNYHAVAKNIPPGRIRFARRWTRSSPRPPGPDCGRGTGWLSSRAASQPFFLHVSFWKPHSPYEVAAPYDAMYDDVEIPIPDTATPRRGPETAAAAAYARACAMAG